MNPHPVCSLRRTSECEYTPYRMEVNIGIVFTGIIEDYYLDEFIEHFKYCNCTKIISTWNYIDPNIIEKLNANGFLIVQSDFPENIHKNSVNYQTWSIKIGIEFAKQIGITHILRLRSDMVVNNINRLLEIYKQIYEEDKLIFLMYINTNPMYLIYYAEFGNIKYMEQYNSAFQLENDNRFAEYFKQSTAFNTDNIEEILDKIVFSAMYLMRENIDFRYLKNNYRNYTNLLKSYHEYNLTNSKCNKILYTNIVIPNIPIIIYTHTDYLDVFDICMKRINRYAKDFHIIIFSNVTMPQYETIVYNDELLYTERLAYCFDQIKDRYEYILFNHENNVLYKLVDNETINTTVKLMKEHNIDQLRLNKNGVPGHTVFDEVYPKIYDIPATGFLFSVAPAIWNLSSILDIVSNNKYSYRNTDKCFDHYMVKFKNCFYYDNEDTFIGTDRCKSNIFPVLHVSINGKWLYYENIPDIDELFQEFSIDKNVRGFV